MATPPKIGAVGRTAAPEIIKINTKCIIHDQQTGKGVDHLCQGMPEEL